MSPDLVQAATVLAQAVDTAQAGGSGAAEFWIFWLIAPLSLAAALSVVILRNPVHAALMLVVNFFTFAVLYAVLQAQFLATIQIIVYAGAIMILFLFVLMLLGVDRSGEQGPGKIRGQRPAALLLGGALFIALTVAVAGPFMGTDSACNTSPAVQQAIADAGGDARPCAGLQAINADEGGGNVTNIGRSLFTSYVWPFEAASVLLVIAAIGAMVLGKRDDDLADLVDVGEAAPPGVPHSVVMTARPALSGGHDLDDRDADAADLGDPDLDHDHQDEEASS
ncbi:MAG TPA: NADH-quinone oxidoreductase subunit J [Euzebya sp.]|nr:NADH-quinone oxidoreductase subunit J [Euzebya sp.]